MFKFLFIIVLFIVLFFFMLGFSLLRGIKFLLFGSPASAQRKNTTSNRQQQYKASTDNKPAEEPQVKIFKKRFEVEEKAGQYVDYEEIKE